MAENPPKLMRYLMWGGGSVTGLTVIISTMWALATPQIEAIAQGVVKVEMSGVSENLEANSAELRNLKSSINDLQKSIEQLQETAIIDQTPSWRWSRPDTSFTDGSAGGDLTVTASGYKLRECGVPVVDLYFEDNGRNWHRLKAGSFITEGSRGIALPIVPDVLQTLSYPATIPEDTAPGRAEGYIALTYPDRCPHLEPAIVGPIPFMIRANRGE